MMLLFAGRTPSTFLDWSASEWRSDAVAESEWSEYAMQRFVALPAGRCLRRKEDAAQVGASVLCERDSWPCPCDFPLRV